LKIRDILNKRNGLTSIKDHLSKLGDKNSPKIDLTMETATVTNNHVGKNNGFLANATSPSFKEITPLKEPHVYAAISTDPETMGLKYIVMEPTLTETEKNCTDLQYDSAEICSALQGLSL